MKKMNFKRSGIAMIELIFAIVIIAISVLSIPSMLNVANEAAKSSVIDDDILSRLAGWTLDKSQARWDANYMASGSQIIRINEGGLDCNNISGIWRRDNNASRVECTTALAPAWPLLSPYPDGNLSLGIERLNGGTETLSVSTATGGGAMYDVNATYAVSYVSSALTSASGNTERTTWLLGSSANMAPGAAGSPTNLKRVVTTFYSDALDINMTLTFFKSNKGN